MQDFDVVSSNSGFFFIIMLEILAEKIGSFVWISLAIVNLEMISK